MEQRIHIGDRGRTLGPLNPTGRVKVQSEVLDASSQGNWIDNDTEIVIVAGNTRLVIVREARESDELIRGAPLSLPADPPETPLQLPSVWVERLNFPIIGLVAGIVLAAAQWQRGIGLDGTALTVPLSGYLSGWLMRAFVRYSAESAGPREDHRPRTYATAFILTLGAMIGVAIGINAGPGFLAVSAGLFGGVLISGSIAVLVSLISMI